MRSSIDRPIDYLVDQQEVQQADAVLDPFLWEEEKRREERVWRVSYRDGSSMV